MKYSRDTYKQDRNDANLLYLSIVNLNNSASLGVYGKCLGQLNSFKRLNFKESYFVYGNKYKQFITDGEYDREINDFEGRLKDIDENRFEKIIEFILEKNINYLYIRYTGFSDRCFLEFLDKVKHYLKKIFIEIPTYPYDNEFEKDLKNNQRNYDRFKKDKKFRKYLYKYVDRVVTFSKHKSIFNIPTINIENGVEVDRLKLHKSNNTDNKNINLIGVANLSCRHGYDRIIYGLKEYYSKKDMTGYDVKFHIVGDGVELNSLKDIVNRWNLNKCVVFHGIKKGKDLDEVFDKCDIAVGILAAHRIGLTSMSPLKSREYVARGIPYIYAHIDNSFSGEEEFTLKITPSDEFVNIYDLIEFYEKVTSIEYLNVDMKKYAKSKFDWDIQMKKVVDEFIKI